MQSKTQIILNKLEELFAKKIDPFIFSIDFPSIVYNFYFELEEEHKGFCEQPCVVTIIMKEIWSQEQGADKRHYHQLSRWIEIRRIEVIWPAHVKPSEQSAYH